MASEKSREELESEIRELGPWHHDLQLYEDFWVGNAFDEKAKSSRAGNDGVSLIEPSEKFFDRLDGVYPDGLSGKRFLDCACNAGAYCFFARALGADYSLGFDVREHWIRQANFVQKHRLVSPTDNIEFKVLDLYELPQMGLDPFDFTFFSGIFYHLPDPIHGLKIAAELTRDVIVVNTAAMYDPENAGGLTPRRRSSSDYVMSGVSELAWFPNGPKAILLILNWLGFKEFKLTKFIQRDDRHRFEVFGAREVGRLENLKGSQMRVRDAEFS